MRVWILQTGEPLHIDEGSPRPMRAMNLTDALIARGHEVVLWSSAFYHQEKRYRSLAFQSIKVNDKLTINLIPSPGYKKNIGLGRLYDHAILARNLSKLLTSEVYATPDVAFVGYPPIESAAVMLRWLKKRSVPSMLDVKDQWPGLFIEPFPQLLKPLAKIAFSPYYYFAHRAFKDASAFSSMSPGYLNWMSAFSGRPLHSQDIVVPLTAPRFPVSGILLADAQAWWKDRGVSSSTKRRFCFVGSFMSVFDFSGIRHTAERFQNEGIDCQFIICGDGGSADEIRSMMRGLSNVIFPGWIDEPKKAALALCSVGALIPYKNIENFTLNTPNKVLDAFAHGLPVITTLSGELQSLIESEKVGFSCNQSTGRDLYCAMKFLLDNGDAQLLMSRRALALFERRFSFKKAYGELVLALERMVEL